MGAVPGESRAKIMTDLTIRQIWKHLEDVKDPEIPVVSVVEMGIVRGVALEGAKVIVRMTPTFSGCPALHAMQADIRRHLLDCGAPEVQVIVQLSPAWTSDWITPQARQKLRAFGLAPPARLDGRIALADLQEATCPQCGSPDTSLKNSFGPTLCRAIYVCNSCRQPFEQFKPI
jgi:ring-1,2-phenylacetyl-CoA epoxidase subunit PaaD